VVEDLVDVQVELDWADIQGLILRGYNMAALRLLVLRVERPAPARRFLGALTTSTADTPLGLTSAVPWFAKPPHCFNVGLSFAGLRALELPDDSLSSFPEEFRQGAVERAAVVGDVGDSDPDRWIGGFAASEAAEAHVFLLLFGASRDVVEQLSISLRSSLSPAGLVELSHHDGDALRANDGTPDRVAHFGYRDGYSQPTIAGAPPSGFRDPLPVAPAGEFLLGHPSQHPGLTYPVPVPEELGRNGSFVAVRILEQDVHGFEEFLDKAAAEVDMDPEAVAAKLCGRWRNGVPLALSPHTDSPDPAIPEADLNDFDYLAGADGTRGFDDAKGYRCPLGSHIRRTNPRGSRIAGAGGNLHRIVRRGLPYGPAYDPSRPDDGIPRGLLGLFIGVSLADQFEFVMADWVNDGRFAPGLGRTKDPLIGDTEGEGTFKIPVQGESAKLIGGFSRFVTTRGGAYCFLPSFAALRRIAAL
jgi:deferrochelatase/peroxidase EfeB